MPFWIASLAQSPAAPPCACSAASALLPALHLHCRQAESCPAAPSMARPYSAPREVSFTKMRLSASTEGAYCLSEGALHGSEGLSYASDGLSSLSSV